MIKYIFILDYSLIDLVKPGKRLDFSLVFDIDTPDNGSIVKVGYSFLTKVRTDICVADYTSVRKKISKKRLIP